MDLLRQYIYHEPARPIPEHVRLVQIDEDPRQLNKNYPLEVGIVGDTALALAELDDRLRIHGNPEFRVAVRERTERHAAKHQAAREKLTQAIEQQRDLRPLSPLALMGALAKVLPSDVAVIEEAVTTTNTTFERLGALKNTTGYFGHRGWGLGWGLGVAIGAKLAWPERPVLALLGDGAAAYGIQGLWTAAKYRIPVVFVICNNAQYQILKICAQTLKLDEAVAERYEGLDVTGPEIDYVQLARAFGVEAKRISEPDELCAAVEAGLRGNQPLLIDVPISREQQRKLNYG
jgi:benzoylformate decarboxylase